MQTVHSLLAAGETEKAGEYIEKLIQETDQFAETTYSENIVVNSIVGIRLNQAKRGGIAVHSHTGAVSGRGSCWPSPRRTSTLKPGR